MADEIKRLDFVDVVRTRLMEAGLENVFPYVPDLTKVNECCAIGFGVPAGEESYYDLTFDTAVRVTVYLSRLLDVDAMADAQLAERVLRTRSLDSANGSYRLIRIETTKPRPVRWDEGRDVWVVEATAHIEMKEF